jgi:hypothetical protein
MQIYVTLDEMLILFLSWQAGLVHVWVFSIGLDSLVKASHFI